MELGIKAGSVNATLHTYTLLYTETIDHTISFSDKTDKEFVYKVDEF